MRNEEWIRYFGISEYRYFGISVFRNTDLLTF